MSLVKIKLYEDSDFNTIDRWWKEAGMEGFNKDFISPTSFMIYEYNINVAFISLITTNIKEYCYLENLVANPYVEKNIRRPMVQQLIKFVEEFARSLGYKKLMCMTPTPKLKEYYQQLGYLPTVSDVSCFIKEL